MLILALLAALPFQEPTLLPEAPEGWRFERLDFPLSFAPEIDYEGFEELRFAPGMFTVESDSYFSYALALRLEGRIAIDVAFLDSFLLTYYVGLCKMVAEGRKLELDLDSITVHVQQGGHGYEATIDMFDPFVTGGPLQLELELSVHRDSKTTELLGLASPKPKTAPIWDELHTLGTRWREARPPAVFLNHLYFVPDTETYEAIAKSKFLHQGFAVFEERTTVRPDLTYTGEYFYGRNTYFEFLKPMPDKGFAPGGTGIGFGFESKGATQLIAANLKTQGIQSSARPMSRELEGKQLPWFEMMGLERASMTSRLSLFTLEYYPSFLDQWHSDLAPTDTGIDRARILQRYAAHMGAETPDDVLFQDITEIHLALDAKEKAYLIKSCRVFGYTIQENADETTCQGPGYRLRIRASKGPGGITGFTVGLRTETATQLIQLGKLSIKTEGKTAVFIIDDA